MRTRNDQPLASTAFTLVELILVMAILATILAFSAPLLSRSFKQRGLEEDAMQLLALTEYARDEAVSQGVPMMVWINPQTGSFGVQAKDGYEGDAGREKTYQLKPDHRFDLSEAPTDRAGMVDAADFDPSGMLAEESLAEMSIVDRSNNAVSVAQTDDGTTYEIVKP